MPNNRPPSGTLATMRGLDFRSGEPIALTDGALNTFEGSAAIADENGSLLFYTDGVTVWNKLHQPMPNERNLWGSYTTTQTLIVPKPGNDPVYYIFTASPEFDLHFGQNSDSVGFHYTVVDLSMEMGLGDVIQKNVLLFKNTTEKVTAVHHANGSDIWVVAHEWGSNNFRSHLITESGINESPVVSPIGTIHGLDPVFENQNAAGSMKLSPDGSKLATVLPRRKLIELFSFDNQNGEISNLLSIIFDPDALGIFYGIEFSSNSKFLYYGKSESGCFNNEYISKIYQYEISSSETKIIGDFLGSLTTLQIALDGKIYVARCNELAGTSGYVAVINNPNRKGKETLFVSDGLGLSGKKNQSGLPNFIQSYFVFPDPVIDMPNVFTPNRDLYNEVFSPIQFENILEANLTIINRWGKTIFTGTDILAGWDGDDAPAGVYYWLLAYEGKNGKTGTAKGWVQLMR